jgi:hypothetical protein
MFWGATVVQLMGAFDVTQRHVVCYLTVAFSLTVLFGSVVMTETGKKLALLGILPIGVVVLACATILAGGPEEAAYHPEQDDSHGIPLWRGGPHLTRGLVLSVSVVFCGILTLILEVCSDSVTGVASPTASFWLMFIEHLAAVALLWYSSKLLSFWYGSNKLARKDGTSAAGVSGDDRLLILDGDGRA